ncbi:MAG: type II secretion system major pseudopilin GspG [Planctomycetota bacterium]
MGKKEQGFTLLELLAVVMIIGLLAAIIAPRLLSKTPQARIAAAKANIKSLQTAIENFHLDHGKYPEKLEDLVNMPSYINPKKWPEGGYLTSIVIPKDPWGNDFIYLKPGRNNQPYEIISLGADGKEGGEKEDADISSSNLSE